MNGKVPAGLDLIAGSYLLKTYNLAYKDMPNWVDTETGGAAFYAEKNFKIDAGKINYLNVGPDGEYRCFLKTPRKVLVIALAIIILPYNSETDP